YRIRSNQSLDNILFLINFVKNVEPGSTCAVFGLGAVGLAAVMGCKDAGAKRIIAVDINSEKAEKAKAFGATDFVNPIYHNISINQVLVEMTNGGVDYSLERVGKVEVMRSALESCIKGWGVSVIVGWTDVYSITVKPLNLLCGRTWKGCMFGGKIFPLGFKSKDDCNWYICHSLKCFILMGIVSLLFLFCSIRTVISLSPE
uniref:Alcohol dehydrogenase-like C-terminal domain-containing protein n=1 Tax=Oryzias sinensis TaxID=183150 RepID=A0A8C8DQI4_9TELE